jgi:hypothetical protein
MAPERSTQVTVPLSYLMIPDPPFPDVLKRYMFSVISTLLSSNVYI